VHLRPEWTSFEFRFCELLSVGWGQRSVNVDPRRLYALHFRLPEEQPHDVWLDDVAFMAQTPELDARRCGPPCPRDAAPSNAVIDPSRLSSILQSAGVTLHTFEQPTKSCGSLTRRYLAYVPKRLARDSSAPVVIALHGAGASAEAFRHYQTHGRFEALGERDGFIVVYGNAAPGASTVAVLPNSGSWNQEPAETDEVDDFGYLDALRADLKQRRVIDGRNAFFLIGQSNGGGMVLAAAGKNPALYTGFAAIMPYLGLKPAQPMIPGNSRLSRVLFAYSEADPGLPKGYASTIHGFASSWAAALGIPASMIAAPVRTALPDRVDEGSGYTGSFANAVATRHSQGVQLELSNGNRTVAMRILQFDRAGHFWPNPTQDSLNLIVEKWGLRNQDIDAADEIWAFFREALD
jgi:poly(3-hydroxybutyrate) depolymerase